MKTQAKPLDGISVIDMTHVLAGPYCTYQLGLLGAQITKVESLKGDMVRNWGGQPDQLNAGLGSGFASQNAGKRSIALDIKSPAGSELIVRMARTADIFVENYRPGALANYGLSYDILKAINPALIYVSISAFGQTGPEGKRPGFDDVIQATSGFMSINVRGDGPIRTGGPVVDYATGMHATSAILAALLLRNSSGKGQYVDVAMQDVTLLLMNRNSSIAATTGTPPPPAENREGPLLGRFKSADGYVMLAGYLPHHCRSICHAIGLEKYAEMSGNLMADSSEQMIIAVEQRLLQKTSAAWDEIFAAAEVVAGGVRDLKEVLAAGQPEARELFSTASTAVGDMQVTNVGYRINQHTFKPKAGIPTLGEHTLEILTELGLDENEVQTLKDSKVIP